MKATCTDELRGGHWIATAVTRPSVPSAPTKSCLRSYLQHRCRNCVAWQVTNDMGFMAANRTSAASLYRTSLQYSELWQHWHAPGIVLLEGIKVLKNVPICKHGLNAQHAAMQGAIPHHSQAACTGTV